MSQLFPEDRITEGGVNVAQLQDKSVVVKVEDISEEQLEHHPLTGLCRGIARLRVGSLQLHGAMNYFPSLAEAVDDGAHFSQHLGPWFDDVFPAHVNDADVIIDLSNSVLSNNTSASIAETLSIPRLSLTWGRTWVQLTSSPEPLGQDNIPKQFQDLHGLPLPPVSRIASGLPLQEFLIEAGQCESATGPGKTVVYDAAAETRTGIGDDRWPELELENLTLDVIGAGGIGVHLLESLTPLLGSSCQVRVFDPDVIGPENLAMQIAYLPSDLGMPKAVVMARILAASCQADILGFEVQYQARPGNLTVPSLRIVCADNYEARFQANQSSLRDGVPVR